MDTKEEIRSIDMDVSMNDIKKALLNSPLFTSNFDCVIIDEAQKLSNNTSNRYKVIYDFLRKSDIKYV